MQRTIQDVSKPSATLLCPATDALNQQLDDAMRCKRRKLNQSSSKASVLLGPLSMTDIHLSLARSQNADDCLSFPPITFSSDDEDSTEHIDSSMSSILSTRKRSISNISLEKHMHGMVRSRTIRSSIYRLDNSLQSQ